MGKVEALCGRWVRLWCSIYYLFTLFSSPLMDNIVSSGRTALNEPRSRSGSGGQTKFFFMFSETVLCEVLGRRSHCDLRRNELPGLWKLNIFWSVTLCPYILLPLPELKGILRFCPGNPIFSCFSSVLVSVSSRPSSLGCPLRINNAYERFSPIFCCILPWFRWCLM